VLACVPFYDPDLPGLGQGLGWTRRLPSLLRFVNDRRGEWGVVFLPVGLLPATEAVAGSRLGAMRVVLRSRLGAR